VVQLAQGVQSEPPTKIQCSFKKKEDTMSSYRCINNALQIKKQKPEDYIITPIQYKGWFHQSW